jgi:hypothetical protein
MLNNEALRELSRLYAPDHHRPNLLAEAQRRGLVAYLDESAGHSGGVYRACSWQFADRSQETRRWLDADGIVAPRRRFHQGRRQLTHAEIEALGYRLDKQLGKLRFVRGLTRGGRKLAAVTSAGRSC